MVDANGTLWLFGGSGYAFDTSSKGGMNDYWSFDTKTSIWTFEGGFAQSWTKPLPNARDQVFAGWGSGTDSGEFALRQTKFLLLLGLLMTHRFPGVGRHGTMGVGSTQNLPGADHAGYSWLDPLDGKLWVMGGENGNTDK